MYTPEGVRKSPFVSIVHGPAEFAEALALRYEVFCDEQRIPREIERDLEDELATHVIARDAAGRVVGTGRVLRQLAGVHPERLVSLREKGAPGDAGRVGRMAVAPAFRRSGLGRTILGALEFEARAAGLRTVLLHAQLQAEPFYLSCAYVRNGPEFEEAGIPHVEMVKSLTG